MKIVATERMASLSPRSSVRPGGEVAEHVVEPALLDDELVDRHPALLDQPGHARGDLASVLGQDEQRCDPVHGTHGLDLAHARQSGELRLTITSDWHSEGEFEMTLALDETVPATPGAEASAPPAAELTLVGTFESEWRVNCRSYISGFTGGHAVADSPYCQSLTF